IDVRAHANGARRPVHEREGDPGEGEGRAPQALRARPAAARAVRGVPREHAAAGLRPVVQVSGPAGARHHPPGLQRLRRVGRVGAGAGARARGPDRNDRRRAPESPRRPRRHVHGARRRVVPELRPWSRVCARVRAHAALAPRRALDRTRVAHHARAGAVVELRRLHRAAHARRHARGVAPGLHPHRARQGPRGARGRGEARAQARHSSGDLLSGAGGSPRHHGLDRHRADLRHPRARALPRRRRDQPRLHAGDGRGAVLCVVPAGSEPARGRGVRLARPQGGAGMSIGLRPPASVLAVTAPPRPPRSLWSDAWARLRRNRMAVGAAGFLIVMSALAVFAPWLPGLPDPALQDLAKGASPPSFAHVFGTDELGRDLFARVLHGGRISLLVGLVGTLVSLLIGVTWGAVAGYVGGRTDDLMMRVVDVLYALPYLFLVILLLVFFSRSLVMLFVALGLVQWLTMARIVRGQVL